MGERYSNAIHVHPFYAEKGVYPHRGEGDGRGSPPPGPTPDEVVLIRGILPIPDLFFPLCRTCLTLILQREQKWITR